MHRGVGLHKCAQKNSAVQVLGPDFLDAFFFTWAGMEKESGWEGKIDGRMRDGVRRRDRRMR